jgi:probable HAF family extracellular repeat protein
MRFVYEIESSSLRGHDRREVLNLYKFELGYEAMKRLIQVMRANAVIVLFLSIFIGQTWGAILYNVTDLGTLGGRESSAYSINNRGEVVGFSYRGTPGPYHAFLYSNGTMHDLGTLGSGYSAGQAINNHGQVVGWADNGVILRRAFHYVGSGPMQDLGIPTGIESWAYGINDAGQIAGHTRTGGVSRAFLYNSGSFQDLGTLGGAESQSWGINSHAQVVGWATNSAGLPRAFLYSGTGPMQDLGTLGGTTSGARDINDLGQVVGSSAISDGTFHAFLWSGSGPMQDLGAGFATAINNRGQIVANSSVMGSNHAFVYLGDGLMQDLNGLIDPASGWTLSNAFDINDLGQIVGEGISPSGETRAFLLTPVPEQSSFVSFATGSICLAGWSWRRRRKC